MGKCPYCGSGKIRRKWYREHRYMKCRCRTCNQVFHKPVRRIARVAVVLAIVLAIVAGAWWFSERPRSSLRDALSAVPELMDYLGTAYELDSILRYSEVFDDVKNAPLLILD